MARRFPDLELVGVEFEEDSVARARATIEAEGLADRIDIRHGKATEPGHVGEYDLAYFQYALHQLARRADGPRRGVGGASPGWPDPRARLAAAVRSGRVPDAPRRDHRRGPARRAVPGHGARDARAVPRLVRGRPACRRPSGIDLPSGASVFLVERPRLTCRGVAVTSIVPVMFGWILQWNGYVPATLNDERAVAPLCEVLGRARSSSSVGPSRCDRWCRCSSSAMTSPTLAVIVAGLEREVGHRRGDRAGLASTARRPPRRAAR